MTTETVSTYELSAEESPTEGVVQALATAAGASPLELDPLYNTLDPEALDTLFSPSPSGGRSGEYIVFEYEGYEVTFFSEGRVTVAPGSASLSKSNQ